MSKKAKKKKKKIAEKPVSLPLSMLPKVPEVAPEPPKPTLTECPTCASQHGLHVPLKDGKCPRCGFTV